MENNDNQHKRRIHYAGKYPRKFEEKYKELNPEKYADEISHVIGKGNTPAGMHIPIMVKEILEVLAIKPGMKGFDATLGYGGHTIAMLNELKGDGHLYSGDIDPIESAKTEQRVRKLGYDDSIWTLRNMNFCQVDELAEKVGGFDFILADLGVSSMQIDDPERGFTFKNDGPWDLRLNPTAGMSAAERLKTVTRDELEGMLRENSDEPYAQEIARQIVNDLKRGVKIETTLSLLGEIEKALVRVKLAKDEKKDAVKKSAARVFQALRIDVNHEYEVLYEFMEKLPGALAPGGRAAILTFHSGEDRIVKKAFKAYKQQGLYQDISDEVIRPSREECYNNSRAQFYKAQMGSKIKLIIIPSSGYRNESVPLTVFLYL